MTWILLLFGLTIAVWLLCCVYSEFFIRSERNLSEKEKQQLEEQARAREKRAIEARDRNAELFPEFRE